MQVSKIQSSNLLNYNNSKNIKSSNLSTVSGVPTINYQKTPVGFRYNTNITFGEFFDPNRMVINIDYEEYMAMTQSTKQRFRKRYRNFFRRFKKDEMCDPKETRMPLLDEGTMDEFIKTASIYKKYKDQPIICLGRSPKWFLNAALWMKDGINNYKFVAFSNFWFWPDKTEGVHRLNSCSPTKNEITAYRKYLKRLKQDPQSIVNTFNKKGTKTVITDFIATGKGATSFLDIMANFAEDQGVLEDFSKSIQIVGIGSMKYMERFYREDECISEPKVFMPPKLQKYAKNVEQEFYDMDYTMFEEMLVNQNTNECRSTYYPHEAWTMYQPDRFKTGLIKDMKKVKNLIELIGSETSFASFTPVMLDFKNLLNFRILDALNHRKLLKPFHKSKL